MNWTDVHAHFLIGTDDGPESLEESLRMARLAALDGTKRIYCTSHLDAEEGPDAVRAILEDRRVRRARLQEAALAEGLGITFVNGAEWMLSADLLDSILASPEGMLGETKAFLFEISPYHPIAFVPLFVTQAVGAGLKPLLAHPERYRQLLDMEEKAARMMLEGILRSGAVLQVTAGSFTGLFGDRPRRMAEKIADWFPDDFVLGSDAHESQRRVPGLAKAMARLETLNATLPEKVQRRLEMLLG